RLMVAEHPRARSRDWQQLSIAESSRSRVFVRTAEEQEVGSIICLRQVGGALDGDHDAVGCHRPVRYGFLQSLRECSVRGRRLLPQAEDAVGRTRRGRVKGNRVVPAGLHWLLEKKVSRAVEVEQAAIAVHPFLYVTESIHHVAGGDEQHTCAPLGYVQTNAAR